MVTTRCCVFFFLCYFFYRFSHTYAQPIGLYDMHPLSVKCRRFDTFQLLLPFNGPIKLFHSYPFDQSDATTIDFFFFLSPQGSAYPLLLAICFSDSTSEQYTFMIKQSTNQSYLIVFSFYRNVLRVRDTNQLLFFPSKVVRKSRVDNYYIA
jgi:hypothetical protein